MFRPCFLLAPLFAACSISASGAETGAIQEFAMADFRLAYDCLPSITSSPEGLIASKQDTAGEDKLQVEPTALEESATTNSPAKAIDVAGRAPDERLVTLRPIATGKAPSLGLLRTRLPSRYSSGAWLNLQSGYGDVLVEDRVGRKQMNGAGIQDPDFLYLKLCIKF